MAIPAQNESGQIEACLDALFEQTGLSSTHVGVLVFINNSDDGTSDIVAACAARGMCPVRIVEAHSDKASAGWARREAMEAAAVWLGEFEAHRRIILTTDADSRVPPDWIKRNLDHLGAGADLVAGRIALDPADEATLPETLLARGRLEATYQALLVELDALLDPDPDDPWPNHWMECGASLAVDLDAYQAVGGVPALTAGEDRALVSALRQAQYRVRHAADIEVITSGRLKGRAVGGVATTIALRIAQPQSPCDDRLERTHRVALRALTRRMLRRLFKQDQQRRAAILTWLFGFAPARASSIAALPCWGDFLAEVETAPRLALRPVRPADLPTQIRLARALLGVLTLTRKREARRAGIEARAFVSPAPQPQPTPQ